MKGGTIAPSRGSRLQSRRERGSHPDVWPLVLVVGSAVLANILALSRFVDENPINWLSNLAIAGQGGITPGQNTIDPSVGWITQALGHYAAVSLVHGHVPWWNPYEGLGAPLVGEMGSASLFPLTILEVFANGHLYAVVILECIAGIATYYLARRLVTNRWAAGAAGAAYGVAGTFAWISHAVINPVPFLPVVLLGVERSVAEASSGRRFGWGLIAIGLALALYGGFPEEVYWFIPLIASWTLVRLWQLRDQRVRLRRAIVKLSLGIATGVLLAGPLLVAFWTYLPHVVPPPHIPAYATASPTGGELSTQIVPYLYGPIGAYSSYDATNTVGTMWSHAGGYLDSTLIFFAVIGVLGRKERAIRWLLFGSLIIIAARLVGFWPVTHLFGLLPGAWISFERYGDPWWELSAALLAGFGLDDVLSGRTSRRGVLIGAAAVLGAVGLAYMYGRTTLGDIWHAPDAPIWIVGSGAWAVGAVLLSVAAATRSSKIVARAGLVGVVALDACLMYAVPQLASQRHVKNDYAAVAFLSKHLGTARFMTLGPIAPDYGSYFKLAELNMEDIPIPRKWANLVADTLDPGIGGVNGAFNFDGITFWQAAGQPSVEAEVIAHVTAYEKAATKYLVVPSSEFQNDPELVSAGLRKVWSDPFTEIFRFPASASFYSVPSSCAVVRGDIAAVTVKCDAPAVLVRRELSLPGWRATVNGKSATVGTSGGVFEAVKVGAGESTVAFSFVPPHMVVGWAALVVGVLLLGGGLGASIRQRRRRVVLET